MPKIPIMKSKDYLKYLEKYGCISTTVKGSHNKITYKNKTTVIPIHNRDLDRGNFSGILKQLDININDFIDFINNN